MVAQLQRQVGNRAVIGLILQRDKKRPSAGRKPPAKVGGGHQQLWVIRDKSIGLGGQLVSDLAAFKSRVMTTADADGWTLVLAVHGSEDRLGAQAPPDWQKNAIFYDKSDIDALFGGDKAFVAWRDKFGPTALALVSCQVSAPFEDALIKNLTRPGAAGLQPKRGLGEGCKPMSTALSLSSVPPSKAQFDRLSAPRKESALDELDQLNQRWGYYGAQPVARDLIAHFYYNEDPKGEWVKVEVGVTDASTHQLKPTGIPFWNRTFGPDAAKFRKYCSQGIATLRQHKATAPPVGDEE
ncbi:MAG: hypothetical protein ABWZ98_01550 [Nakamurella sp.]